MNSEPCGTYACPICGKDKPHTADEHKQDAVSPEEARRLVLRLRRIDIERHDYYERDALWTRLQRFVGEVGISSGDMASRGSDGAKTIGQDKSGKQPSPARPTCPAEWPVCDYTQRPCLDVEQVCRCQKCKDWASHLRAAFFSPRAGATTQGRASSGAKGEE
jgi:hypothetical protein